MPTLGERHGDTRLEAGDARAPLVSVLVPVYNGEPYLRECLQSVLDQRYGRWECVVVDNASTDASGEIAREFAARDARFRVVRHARTLPMVDNFNAAIACMSPAAEYCKLLMADDWLFPEFLEQTLAVALEAPGIGLVCTIGVTNSGLRYHGMPFPSRRVPGREMGRWAFLSPLYVFGSPTSCLMRADVVRSLVPFYNPENIHCDHEACYALLARSDFAFVHQVLHYVRQHDATVSSRILPLGSPALGDLYILNKHGPVFLSAQEYATRFRSMWLRYHLSLAEALLERRGRDFWAYQRPYLARAGLAINPALVVAAMPIAIGGLVRRIAARLLRALTRSADAVAANSAGRNRPEDRGRTRHRSTQSERA